MLHREYLVRKKCRRGLVFARIATMAAAALFVDAAHALAPQDCALQRVSVTSAGQSAAGASSRGTLSVDGRFVAFESVASNLVGGDSNGVVDVFVFDRWTGATERVSVSSGGLQGDQGSRRAMICGNGRFVAFESEATNLVPGDTNGETDIFLHDRQTRQTTRASVGPAGLQSNSWSLLPTLSFDGRFIAFHSAATNLVSNDANGIRGDIFVRDRVAGVTELVSVSSSEVQGNFTSQGPSISSNGGFVAFESFATNLVAGMPSQLGKKYIYLRDRAAGTTQLVSVTEGGELPNGTSQSPSVSADGRVVVYQSRATNLWTEVESGHWNIYLREVAEPITELVSAPAFDSDYGHGDSEFATISADGMFVAFMSFSAQLIPNEEDDFGDVYVFDRAINAMSRLSVASDGSDTDGSSVIASCGSISPSGRQVVFHSAATTFAEGDENGVSDVFVQECVATPFVAFCSGTERSCPCGNATTSFAGCQSSFATGGAALSASGTPSVEHDTITLTATGLPPFSQALFFQGDAQVAAPLGEISGDGVRCIEGAIVRLGLRTGASGSVSFGKLVPGDPSIAFRGGVPIIGGMRFYQALFRDNGNFCTPGNTNLSNAITIEWAP